MERRAFARLLVRSVPHVFRSRLRSGAEAMLLDLSPLGALIESPRRLLPGAPVDLQVLTAGGRFELTGRIVRAEVSAIAPGAIRYRGGIQFEARCAGAARSLGVWLEGKGYPETAVSPG
jgi:hypothetical protein